MPMRSPLKRLLAVSGVAVLVVGSWWPAAAAQELDPGALVRVAGTGEPGGPDGEYWGEATDMPLGSALDIAVDDSGALYAADYGNNRVRTVPPDGRAEGLGLTREQLRDRVVSVAVGPDSEGPVSVATESAVLTADSADWSEATDALGDVDQEFEVSDHAVAADGTVYLADTSGLIHRIAPDGTVDTVAGGGEEEPTEVIGSEATEAVFDPAPRHLAVDEFGDVYFTVEGEPRVYRVEGDGGELYIEAGSDTAGFDGDGGIADMARLSEDITGIAVGPEGTRYIADAGNNRIRAVDYEGVITSLPPHVAQVDDLAVGPEGDLYIAGSHEVLRYNPEDPASYTDTTTGNAEPPEPGADPWSDLAAGETATVEFADPEVDSPLGFGAGPGPGIDVDGRGQLYVPDENRAGVLGVDPSDGSVELAAEVLGAGTGDFLDSGVAVGPDGAVYIADRGAPSARDDGGRVLRVDPDGATTVVAGGGRTPIRDGLGATEVRMNPGPVALGEDGTLYVADAEDGVTAVDPYGDVRSVGSFHDPQAVAVDGDGTVFVADEVDHQVQVRSVADDGTVEDITAVAPDAVNEAEMGDSAAADEVRLSGASDIEVADDGTLFVATGNGIQRITPHGTMSPVVESSAEIADDSPGRLALDPHGNLYFTVPGEREIRVVARPGEVAGPASATAVVLWAAAVAVLLGGAVVYWRAPLGAAARRVFVRY